MALWLNLIPQLHQSGGSDVAMLHHNFRDERPEFYEGNYITIIMTFFHMGQMRNKIDTNQ
jgi:hypothetical protein